MVLDLATFPTDSLDLVGQLYPDQEKDHIGVGKDDGLNDHANLLVWDLKANGAVRVDTTACAP